MFLLQAREQLVPIFQDYDMRPQASIVFKVIWLFFLNLVSPLLVTFLCFWKFPLNCWALTMEDLLQNFKQPSGTYFSGGWKTLWE